MSLLFLHGHKKHKKNLIRFWRQTFIRESVCHRGHFIAGSCFVRQSFHQRESFHHKESLSLGVICQGVILLGSHLILKNHFTTGCQIVTESLCQQLFRKFFRGSHFVTGSHFVRESLHSRESFDHRVSDCQEVTSSRRVTSSQGVTSHSKKILLPKRQTFFFQACCRSMSDFYLSIKKTMPK